MNSFYQNKKFLWAFLVISNLLGIAVCSVAVFQRGLEHGYSEYYIRYGAFNLCFLLLLYLLRVPVSRLLNSLEGWLAVEQFRRERKITSLFGLFFVLTYFARIHWGFWWPGIPGWEMRAPKEIRVIKDEEIKRKAYPKDHFLYKAVQPEVAKLAVEKESYTITKRTMYLFYEDGSVYPFNYGLFGVVFNNLVFGTQYSYLRDEDVFKRVLVEKLSDRINRGSRFLMPEVIAYPDHNIHVPLPFASYPEPSELEKVEAWQIDLAIDRSGEVFVTDAKLRFDAKF